MKQGADTTGLPGWPHLPPLNTPNKKSSLIMTDPGCRCLCMGLSIHYPYYVETSALEHEIPGECSTCFSRSQKTRFRDYLSQAILPAMDVSISWLDAGEALSLSVSGLAIEQLLGYENDAADILMQLMQHRSVEILGQTYYRSVAGLFSETDEFISQVSRHAELMDGLFGRRPKIFENTEFVFNSGLTDAVRSLGFSALYSEGYETTFPVLNQNYVYSCHGLPILIRNCRLSDDIAHRFGDATWDRYPLSPEKYAGWLAETPGDCIHIRLDAGIFSGAACDNRALGQFFQVLPEALCAKDIITVLPSEVSRNPPQEEIRLEDLGLVSSDRAYALTGIRNIFQQSAFWCLEDARYLIPDKESWRRFQSTDHFSRMDTISGSCGRVAVRSTSQEAYDYFTAYLTALARCEAACLDESRCPPAAQALRCLPPDKAFHFHSGHRFIGYSAYSLKEFSRLLEFIPEEVFLFHQERGDFSRWIDEILGDSTLAERIKYCTSLHEAADLARGRGRELCNQVK